MEWLPFAKNVRFVAHHWSDTSRISPEEAPNDGFDLMGGVRHLRRHQPRAYSSDQTGRRTAAKSSLILMNCPSIPPFCFAFLIFPIARSRRFRGRKVTGLLARLQMAGILQRLSAAAVVTTQAPGWKA